MSTFKTALRVAAAHPLYLVIYTLFISSMGLFVAFSVGGGQAQGAAFAPFEAKVVMVDRDGSGLSRALVDYVGQNHTLVEAGQDEFALQDALAQREADCVLFVPEGFESELLAAARAGEEPPQVELANGTRMETGALMASEVSRWTSLAVAAAALEPQASGQRVAQLVGESCAERAQVEVMQAVGDNAGAGSQLSLYLKFDAYSVCSSVIVCVGTVFTAMSEKRVAERVEAAGVSSAHRALSTFAACAVLAVLVWVVAGALGVIALSGTWAGIGLERVCLAQVALLGVALFSLAAAFLLSQLGAREQLLNAAGNVCGMVLTFFGGAWIPLEYTGAEVQAIAKFMPTYWANQMIEQALGAPALTPDVLAGIAGNFGLVLLMSGAVAAVGLALARVRH